MQSASMRSWYINNITFNLLYQSHDWDGNRLYLNFQTEQISCDSSFNFIRELFITIKLIDAYYGVGCRTVDTI